MKKLFLLSLLIVSASALAEEQITNPAIFIYQGLKLEAKKTQEDSQIIVMMKEVGPLRCEEISYKNGESKNYGCELTYDSEKSVSEENQKIYQSVEATAQDWISGHIDTAYINESRKELAGLSCARITKNESGTHRELSTPTYTCTLKL